MKNRSSRMRLEVAQQIGEHDRAHLTVSPAVLRRRLRTFSRADKVGFSFIATMLAAMGYMPFFTAYGPVGALEAEGRLLAVLAWLAALALVDRS